jgi:hypothetical protein
MNMSFRKLEIFVGLALAILAFTVYLATLCPTVNFIDSGELATDVYTLGIPHPTGYSLFTLLGYIFSHLPLGFRVIYQLNLMAAVLCSGAVFVFFRLILFIMNDVAAKGEKERKTSELATKDAVLSRLLPASFATLVLCFSETYWSQALSIEVYSLHLLLVGLVLTLFIKAVYINLLPEGERKKISPDNRYWFAFAFVLGLSFTNHGTTILLAPAFLVTYFYLFGITSSRSWKSVVSLAVPFFLGLSALLYLPLRASQHPVMNWGDPETLEKFFWHVRGRQYTVWLFESWETAAKQFKYFVDTLGTKFAYVPLILAAIGCWNLFKTDRQLFGFTLLLFLGCIGYSINYDIHDIDSYFLLAYVTVALWTAFGVRVLLASARSSSSVAALGAGLLFACGYLVYHNIDEVSEHTTYVVEDYTRAVFQSTEPQSIVISYQWDYFVSASLYFQLVEKERPDLVIIDKELLRRTWYLQLLQQRFPEIIGKSTAELDAYVKELNKFEHDLPYNPNVIEYQYTNFIRSIIDRNIAHRHVYVTQEIEPRYTGNYQRIPSGLAFELSRDTAYHPVRMPELSLRVPPRSDPYVDGITSMFARACYNNAMYALRYGKREEAALFNAKALEIKPDLPEAAALGRQLQP